MIKSNKDMRPAFSMIAAIFFILLMASVGAFVMSLSGKMVQETTTEYRKEQAALYAKSYTEYAIMAATAKTCVRRITANVDGNGNEVKAGQGYRIRVDIRYLGNPNPQGCTNTVGTTAITDPRSAGSIIIVDTYVRYRDPESPAAIAGDPWSRNPGITYHRRTLQRL